MPAIDGSLIGGPGTSNIVVLGQQHPKIERRSRCPVDVAAIDGSLVGGPGTSNIVVFGEQ